MVTVIRKELNDNVIPRHLQALENIAEKSLTGWITGTNEPSIADFILVPRLEWLTSGANTGISTEILNAFPHLLSLIQKLKNLPAIKSYSLNKQTIF
jgi:glutathione S-transferase